MNILRCRAHTRQHIREHSVEVDQLESVILSTVCKLNVVRKENERFVHVQNIPNTLNKFGIPFKYCSRCFMHNILFIAG